jgi:hypothetical protein
MRCAFGVSVGDSLLVCAAICVQAMANNTAAAPPVVVLARAKRRV